jgi:polyhydroxyalkanoate synthesis regulator phasin
MPDKDKAAVATLPAVAVPGAATGTVPAPGTPPIPPRRSPGHRGADVKDTVAEMAAKAHEISLEAGSKMAAAMKDVVGAAAGLTGLVVESARDLLQYMVRRGQMTQDEADKLMREVESSHGLKRKAATPFPPIGTKSAPKVVEAPKAAAVEAPKPVVAAAVRPAPFAVKPSKPAAKHAPAKKPVAKKTTMKPAAKKHASKSAPKSKGKSSAKSAKRR